MADQKDHLALLNLINLIELLTHKPVSKSSDEWRKGYFQEMQLDGNPPYPFLMCIQLYEWLKEYLHSENIDQFTSLGEFKSK